jgi:thiamine biosynthesis lipoprotein
MNLRLLRALTGVLTAVILTSTTVAVSAGQDVRVRRDVYLMGTDVVLETLASDRESGLARLGEMIAVIEVAEGELSTWRESSVLSRLNRWPQGQPFRLDSEICRLFLSLDDWFTRTGGVFDPAIGALIEAWGLRATPRRPGPGELESALNRSGFHQLRIAPAWCEVTRLADVRLDAGAFGKGEALDRVEAATDRGASAPWIIDFGGQVMVGGQNASWPVRLAHPRDRRRSVVEVVLSEGSLATSGGSERQAGPIGHILNPVTGETISRPESVVVWHEQALVADILSTALYVMGPREGLRWARAEGFAACFLVPDGDAVELRATSEFRRKFLN